VFVGGLFYLVIGALRFPYTFRDLELFEDHIVIDFVEDYV
jgi:hypothetical protein